MAIVTYSCTKCKPIDRSILQVYLALKELEDTAYANEDERVAAEEARVEAETARAEEFALLHEQAGGDHSVAEGDHTRAEADHATASADHENAVADRNGYDADHTAAVADHTVAASDHVRAEQDHTRADADHTRTLGYGEISERDHARAVEDHEAIFGDHSIFVDDHNQYLADHATAEEDHAAAVAATAAANAAGITSASASVDSNVGTPSVDVSLVNKQLSLSFHNIKGDKGEKGDRGDGVIPVVNDLVTGGTDAALSAEMGKTLNTTKQATLVSGTNIKTVNGESLLGEGNIVAGDPNAVKYVEQTLTDAQKAQARTNIGAYQKPSGGIPKADLDTGVQGSLDLADTAIQAQPVGSITPPADPSEWATAEEVAQLEAKVDDLEDTTDAFSEMIKTNEDDALYITDGDGNVIAKINSDGIKSIDYFDKDSNSIPATIASIIEANSNIKKKYGNTLFITDGNGFVIAKIDSSGLHAINHFDTILFGKKIVSLSDSLGTSGKWQERICELTGAIFDKDLNYTSGAVIGNYSFGGSKTINAGDDNCGQRRARRLVEEGLIVPDIIFIECVNDYIDTPPPYHTTPTNISDEPFFLDVVETLNSVQTSKENAELYFSNNFLAIVGQYTAKKGTAIRIPYTTTAFSVVVTAPSTNGHFDIVTSNGETKRVEVTSSDTIATVIDKIMEYSFDGWTFVKTGADSFKATPNDSADTVSFENITCGCTFTQTGTTNTNYINRYFCSVDASLWDDDTVWKEHPGLYAAYKGLVEYLQYAFPLATIVWWFPETWAVNYNSPQYLRADGTRDIDKLNEYKYVSYLFNLQKTFAEYYNLRYIDLRGKTGFNYMNIEESNSPGNVHPHDVAYQRWGDEIVRELN